MGPAWPRLGAAVLGFIWFLHIGGGPTLVPTNISWLFHGDWQQHWLGFLFFIDEPWSFPLGEIQTLAYPIGTTVGFTDSNPLLSLLVKPFSAVLPDEFQLMGIWFATCFVLQGYFGAALASVVTRDRGQQLLAGYLFVLSPVLLGRMGHDTLCAHWLVLGILYLGLREHTGQQHGTRSMWLAAGLVALAAAIHPYLAAMCLALAVALCLRLWVDRVVAMSVAAAGIAVTAAALAATFGAIGYFGDTTPTAGGFGIYSADLLTLVNPGSFSKLLGGLPTGPGQGEGLGFLGLGGLVAATTGLGCLAFWRPSIGRGRGVVLATILLLGIYALSSRVTLAGAEVLNLETMYRPLSSVASTFRSSGRFIWPLHYLALLFGVWGATRIGRRTQMTTGTAVLAALVTLQATDLKADNWWSSPKKFREARASQFELAQGRYRHLALYPMHMSDVCVDSYDEDRVYRFMLLAHRLKLTYNSGKYARLPDERVRTACRLLTESLSSGDLDKHTIYVVVPEAVEQFRAIGAGCGRSDGDWYCVSKDSDPGFRTHLAEGKLQ
jgi:hypothetical protein